MSIIFRQSLAIRYYVLIKPLSADADHLAGGVDQRRGTGVTYAHDCKAQTTGRHLGIAGPLHGHSQVHGTAEPNRRHDVPETNSLRLATC